MFFGAISGWVQSWSDKMTYISYKMTIKKLERDLDFKDYVIKQMSERIAELEKLLKNRK